MLHFGPGILDKFSDALVGDTVRFYHGRDGRLLRIAGDDKNGRRCMSLSIDHKKAGRPRTVRIAVDGPVPCLDVKAGGRLYGGALLSFDAQGRLSIMRMQILTRPPLAMGMLDFAWEYDSKGRLVRALRNRKPALTCRYNDAGQCVMLRDYVAGYRVVSTFDNQGRETRRKIVRLDSAGSRRTATLARCIYSGKTRSTEVREAPGRWNVTAVMTQGAPPAIVKTLPDVSMRWADAHGRLLCDIRTDRAASLDPRKCFSAPGLCEFADAAIFLRTRGSRRARFMRKTSGRIVQAWEMTFNRHGRPVRAVNLRPAGFPEPVPDELLDAATSPVRALHNDPVPFTRRSLLAELNLETLGLGVHQRVLDAGAIEP